MSLSVTLQNIKFRGKCSLLVDLASRYEEVPPEGSRFADLRNAMIILIMMDQYLLSPDITPETAVQVEQLLRIALFCNLRVPDPKLPNATIKTAELRKRLAMSILERERRGVVPNCISYGWFIFAVAISIEGGK